MICRKVRASLPDLLLSPDACSPEVRAHVEACEACGSELRELRATMSVLEGWEAPEVSPYFDGRLRARLREEQTAAPAGWLERMRERWQFGEKMNLRPLAAGALALAIAVGGGVYEGFITPQPVATPTQSASPVIRDLQSLDENAVVFQELNSLDQDSGSGGAKTGGSL